MCNGRIFPVRYAIGVCIGVCCAICVCLCITQTTYHLTHNTYYVLYTHTMHLCNGRILPIRPGGCLPLPQRRGDRAAWGDSQVGSAESALHGAGMCSICALHCAESALTPLPHTPHTLYTVQNNLLYYALSHLDAATFQVSHIQIYSLHIGIIPPTLHPSPTHHATTVRTLPTTYHFPTTLHPPTHPSRWATK
jgi:hypothetical protein